MHYCCHDNWKFQLERKIISHKIPAKHSKLYSKKKKCCKGLNRKKNCTKLYAENAVNSWYNKHPKVAEKDQLLCCKKWAETKHHFTKPY